MLGHKICLYGEIWLISPRLSLLPLLISSTALDSSFYVSLKMKFVLACSFISDSQTPSENISCIVITYLLLFKAICVFREAKIAQKQCSIILLNI